MWARLWIMAIHRGKRLTDRCTRSKRLFRVHPCQVPQMTLCSLSVPPTSYHTTVTRPKQMKLVSCLQPITTPPHLLSKSFQKEVGMQPGWDRPKDCNLISSGRAHLHSSQLLSYLLLGRAQFQWNLEKQNKMIGLRTSHFPAFSHLSSQKNNANQAVFIQLE